MTPLRHAVRSARAYFLRRLRQTATTISTTIAITKKNNGLSISALSASGI